MRKVAKKWIKSSADELAVANGCYFDEAAAVHVDDFFRKNLCHSKGSQWAGKPFELLDWQRDDIIFPIFGWMREDGTRRYRKAYIELPKKNGKSTLGAGVGLYLLCADGEPGAEIYSAATDQAQASIVHDEAINMVDASPRLSAILKVNRSNKNIALHANLSFYRALSGDAINKEGLNAHGIIDDELHVWKGRKLWEALRYAFRARRQGLNFAITTAGDDMHSVCREQHDYAVGVAAGTVKDDRFFGYIREATAEDDIFDKKIWYKANPSMGITINEKEFAADIEEARQSPSSLAAMKRYSFNIWMTAENPWLNLDDWKKCEKPFTANDLLGRECWAGLDLSKSRDMTSLVLAFPESDGSVSLLPYFWLPESTLEDTRQANRELYRVWSQDGFLELTEGNTIDYKVVRERLVSLKSMFNLRKVAFDPMYAQQLATELHNECSIECQEFRQTVMNFAPACAEFEKLITDGNLKHNGNPILSWQAGHVNVRTDANNNKRPVKPTPNDPRKIDGIVAAIEAVGSMIATPREAEFDIRVV